MNHPDLPMIPGKWYVVCFTCAGAEDDRKSAEAGPFDTQEDAQRHLDGPMRHECGFFVSQLQRKP